MHIGMEIEIHCIPLNQLASKNIMKHTPWVRTTALTALLVVAGSAQAGLLRTLTHGVAFGAGVALVSKGVDVAAERCRHVMDPEKGHKVLQCSKSAPESAPVPPSGIDNHGR
jgi:hypothetical protein